jgi:hypothetical protein
MFSDASLCSAGQGQYVVFPLTLACRSEQSEESLKQYQADASLCSAGQSHYDNFLYNRMNISLNIFQPICFCHLFEIFAGFKNQ